MKKLLLINFLILLFCVSVFSQGYEIGQPSELQGLKKIYIDTDTDLQNRERITKEINKAKLGLVWVDDKEDAEILIVFKARRDNVDLGAIVPTTVYSGRFLVFVARGAKVRLIMSYENEQQTDWEQKPTTKFAKEFVKYYRQANAKNSTQTKETADSNTGKQVVGETDARSRSGNITEIAGTYTGAWKSELANFGGALVLTITIRNGAAEVRAAFTGSDYLNEDTLETNFSSMGAGVWKMEYKGKKFDIQGTALLSGNKFVGDYKFRVSGNEDIGSWVLTKAKN